MPIGCRGLAAGPPADAIANGFEGLLVRDRRRDGNRAGGGPGEKELVLHPLEVIVEGDNFERAVKALKRRVAQEGIYKELKRRRFYEKPSVKRKRKQREAERRRRKERRRALRAAMRRK